MHLDRRGFCQVSNVINMDSTQLLFYVLIAVFFQIIHN